MKTTRLKLIVLFCLYGCYLTSCSEAKNKNEPAITPAPSDLNAFVTKLPEASGYTAFQNNCVSCHSARYVQMQPKFPEKTWLALVTKMQKNYGAPVPDSSVGKIVQYLVAIKGTN